MVLLVCVTIYFEKLTPFSQEVKIGGDDTLSQTKILASGYIGFLWSRSKYPDESTKLAIGNQNNWNADYII